MPAAVEATSRALKAVLGVPLHAGWLAAIADDCRVGAAEIWTTLTAERVRRAVALARKDGKRFGPWAVRAEYFATPCQRAAGGSRAKRPAEADKAEADRAEAERQRRQIREHFQSLGEDERERFLAEARRQCPARIPAVVKCSAQFLAWQAAQANAPPPG